MASKTHLLKIDLLPEYVALERRFKRVLLAGVLLLLAVLVGLGLHHLTNVRQQEKLTADIAAIEPIAAKTTAATTAADAADSANLPVQTVVNFLSDASKTGAERAALIDLTRRYIYDDAVINLIDFSDGQTITVQATVRTPDEYANFFLALRKGTESEQGPLFSQLPIASGIPGYPTGESLEAPPQPLSYTPQRIVYPLAITARGPLRTDKISQQGLLVVPAEPSGTSVGVTTNANGAGGAGGSSAGPQASSSGAAVR